MTDEISDTVKRVYARARDMNFGEYDQPLEAPGCPRYLTRPKTPGQSAYPPILRNVTAFRITGSDPLYDDAEPMDVPQSVIRANFISLMDGLNLFFPDDAIAKYFSEQLALPVFQNLEEDFKDSYSDYLIENLPRTDERIKIEVDGSVAGHFRASLERDFTAAARTVCPEENSQEPIKDRRVLSNDELHRTYLYSRQEPALWVGLALWQNIVRQYAHEMIRLHMSDESLGDAFESPQHKFLRFVRGSVSKSNLTFQTFILPHIINRISTDKMGAILRAEDINDGVTEARTKGIFRREFHSPFGPRRVVCPFGAHATRWLTQDLGGNNNPKDSILVRCYQKVLDEKGKNKKVKGFFTAVKDGLKYVIEERESLPPHSESELAFPHVPSNSDPSAPESSKCPYHQALG